MSTSRSVWRGTWLVALASCLALALTATACDEPQVVGPPVRPGGGGAKADKESAPAAGGAQAGQVPGAQSPDAGAEKGLRLNDDDFVEVDTDNRNPFRSFADAFKVDAPKTVQRRVLMPDTSIDQMRLIAIISGVSQPRAMLVDPAGVGHVVKRGDYIGRPEVIQAGGAEGMPVTLNWRVDRIRSNEVVLAREDPTAPNRPPLTRVVPLFTDAERPELKALEAQL